MLKHNKMMVEITLKVILCKTISQITNNNSVIINKNACKKRSEIHASICIYYTYSPS